MAGFWKQIKNVWLEKLAADPVTGVSAGRMYYNTTDNVTKVHNGTSFQNAGGATQIGSGTDSLESVSATDGDASGLRGIALGKTSVASATNSLAIGTSVTATGINSSSFGSASDATADGALALGNNAQATVTDAAAVGKGSIASHSGSTSVGKEAATTAADQVVIGRGSSHTKIGGTQIVGATLAADPTGIEGGSYYNNVSKKLKLYNGATWDTLESGGALQGVTDGSVGAAGDVGEVIRPATTNVSGVASASAQTVASITLTPGDWMLTANVIVNTASASVTGYCEYTVTTNIGGAPASGSLGTDRMWFAVHDSRGSGDILIHIPTGAGVTYHIRALAAISSGLLQMFGSLTAVRIR